jgi:hypothetical protein
MLSNINYVRTTQVSQSKRQNQKAYKKMCNFQVLRWRERDTVKQYKETI